MSDDPHPSELTPQDEKALREAATLLRSIQRKIRQSGINEQATGEIVENEEKPFPGSAADFYERNQLLLAENATLKAALEAVDDHGRALSYLEHLQKLKAELEEVTKQRDKALDERHEWMQKTTEARQEIARLKEEGKG